jgi:WD40 repeat protein
VLAGQRVYWVDPAGAFVPELGYWSQLVRYLNLATGKIATAGPGQTVFLSADGRYLLMSQTATSLTQTPTVGRTPRTLTLPPGWYLPGGDGLADVYSGAGVATANGILVEARQSPGPGGTVIGLWNPAGHRVTVIGRAQAVIGAHTPPGAGDTQLAWIPAGCGDCPVRITDTATMAIRSVRSPLGHGFARGGAFSPDGTTLALFARLDNPDAARLMLVDLATGSARVAREPQLAVGAGIGWAQWVPDGRRLVMGSASTGGGYLVDTVTLSARPLTVIRGHGQDRTSNQDPNYTTVLIPPPR